MRQGDKGTGRRGARFALSPCLLVPLSLQFQRHAGSRQQDFTPRKIAAEDGAEPLDGGHVAVDEDDLFRSHFIDVRAQAFAGGMRGEIELLDLAEQGLRRRVGAKLQDVPVGREAEAAGGRFGIGVADGKRVRDAGR